MQVESAALLHDVDDTKYFPDHHKEKRNALSILHEAQVPAESMGRVVLPLTFVASPVRPNLERNPVKSFAKASVFERCAWTPRPWRTSPRHSPVYTLLISAVASMAGYRSAGPANSTKLRPPLEARWLGVQFS
jgi:hypothetical protein